MKIILSLLSILFLISCGVPYTAMPDDPRYEPIIPDVALIEQPKNGSLFSATGSLLLYQDMKAHRVGDIITVKLVEQTSASKDADTNFKKEYENSNENPTILGGLAKFTLGKIPFLNSKSQKTLEQNIETESEFNGSGGSSQNNTLSGDISVTVSQVLPNGYLVIRGEKWITLNKGSEYIRLSGIVRPQDVDPNNEVVSTRIANARITYSGKGEIADANTSGWLSKFFNKGWYPF